MGISIVVDQWSRIVGLRREPRRGPTFMLRIPNSSLEPVWSNMASSMWHADNVAALMVWYRFSSQSHC